MAEVTIVYLDLLQVLERAAESSKEANLGAMSGITDDKGLLDDIITAELKKPGNHGDFLCLTKFQIV